MYKMKFVLTIFLIFYLSVSVFCQVPDTVVLKKGLVIKLPHETSHSLISPDAIVASIITGKWKAPVENEEVKSEDKLIGTWQVIKSGTDGWYKGNTLRHAYIYFRFHSDKNEIALIEAMGDRMFFVNGKAHSGNPYRDRDTYNSFGPRFDYSLIPVKLNKGDNDLLFSCRRGYFKVKIHKNINGLIFDNTDLTIPDLIINKSENSYGAVPVINATKNFYKDIFIKTWSGNSTPVYQPVDELYPLSIFKTAFRIKLPAYNKTGDIKLNLELVKKGKAGEKVLSSSAIKMKVLNVGDDYRETFISKLDGSVQYYAINPPINLKEKPALFLSLHGAGVEAINQAEAYYHKDWGYIVCPTNRRPYGYDWENWGRQDALEVLNITKKEFNVDRNRIYLTGHSMGGHGVWHLGVNYPDLFGAIGPSAGWISYWSYRISSLRDSTPVTKMLVRSLKQSDTYAFATNLKPDGIYIIQGSKDDNVPPEQAESMVKVLSKFHKDFIYYVEPGAGHWWDVSDEPGADCVDWSPLFDFFAHHDVASNNMIDNINFVTANPAIASKDYWVQIINQIKQQKLSKINFSLEPGKREFIGTASNVEMLSIDASMLPKGQPITVVMNGQIMPGINVPNNGKVFLKLKDREWNAVDRMSTKDKYPARCGNFREAFNHNVLFVYGTHGDKAENKWALDKVKCDEEKIWYQGNAAIQIIPDDEFSLAKYKDRSVILFGNSKTNSAWNKLLKNSPVQVDNNKIVVGGKEYKGKDYACLMIRPRSDSKVASVGVIGGTGLKGMELVNLADYFDQYTSFPDIVIYNSSILKSDSAGVKFTGYFGNDWSLDNGEFVSQ